MKEQIATNPLGEWQLIDVLWRGPAHPQRWFMGVRDGGARVVILSGHPDRWEQVLDGTEIADATGAVRLAVAHADATRDMARGFARVESVEEIRFLRTPPPDAVPVIEQIKETHARRLHPPRATGDGPWTVELWTVTDVPTVEAPNLPVPQAR